MQTLSSVATKLPSSVEAQYDHAVMLTIKLIIMSVNKTQRQATKKN